MATDGSTLTVDLGDQMRVVEERVKDGSYASADEVIRAALRALEREEADTNAWLLELAEESAGRSGDLEHSSMRRSSLKSTKCTAKARPSRHGEKL